MRVSFVLRSAEASSLGLCNIIAPNYRDHHHWSICGHGLDWGNYRDMQARLHPETALGPTFPTIGTSRGHFERRQLRGVPGRSPSPVLTRPCIA